MKQFLLTLCLGAAMVANCAAAELSPLSIQRAETNSLPETTVHNNPFVTNAEQGAKRLDQPASRLLPTMAARQAKPSTMAKAPSRAQSENTEVILEEDFSLFASGSEDNINTSVDLSGYVTDFDEGIANPYSYTVDSNYTQMPGWTGLCVYQAGGAAALYYPNLGGVLNTPNTLNLFGIIRVTCRAKCIGSYNNYLSIVPCYGSYANLKLMTDDYGLFVIKPADGWVDIEYECEVPYTGDDAFFQFNAQFYRDGILLDDIKIERILDRVMSPYNVGTTCYTDDGFTLKWDADPRSDSYIVNCWEVKNDGQANVATIDFNNMTYDAEGQISDFDVPAGWNVDLSTIASQVATNPNDGTDAIAFIYDEARYYSEYWLPSISTPTGALISDFKAEIVTTKENTEVNEWYGIALGADLMVEGIYADGSSDYLVYTNIDNTVGATYNFDLSNVEIYDGYYQDCTNMYYGLRIYIAPYTEEAEAIMDNVYYESSGSNVETQIIENLSVVDMNYALTGLNMDAEHYFTVQACLGDFVTKQGERQHAFGIPAPVALPATNIDERGEFTANWTAVPKATAYYIHTKARYTAEEDYPAFPVINEAFDKTSTSKGTISNPVLYSTTESMNLDSYTVAPGWSGLGVQIAAGMVGCQAYTEELYYIATPDIDLTNGDGKASVYVKAYGTPGDFLAVQYEMVIAYGIEFDENGVAEGTVTFDELDYGNFYFISYYGEPFLLDTVKIEQDLYAGETVEIAYGITYVGSGEADHCDFAGLDLIPGMKFYYSVYSYTSDSMTGERYLSESSNDIEVNFNTTSVQSIASEQAKATVKVEGRTIVAESSVDIYDIQGRQVALNVTSATVAPGIYVVKMEKAVSKVIVK